VSAPERKNEAREYLTEAEVARLIKAASGNRWGHRDGAMILVAYRHGLRAAELVDLRCGIRWISAQPPCTSVGSSRAHPARIRLSAMN
jgi:site-specific recombinase XerD